MKKWIAIVVFIVTWNTTETQQISCPEGTPETIDTYTEKPITCWSSAEVSHHNREFQTMEEAKAFVEAAPAPAITGLASPSDFDISSL